MDDLRCSACMNSFFCMHIMSKGSARVFDAFQSNSNGGLVDQHKKLLIRSAFHER